MSARLVNAKTRSVSAAMEMNWSQPLRTGIGKSFCSTVSSLDFHFRLGAKHEITPCVSATNREVPLAQAHTGEWPKGRLRIETSPVGVILTSVPLFVAVQAASSASLSWSMVSGDTRSCGNWNFFSRLLLTFVSVSVFPSTVHRTSPHRGLEEKAWRNVDGPEDAVFLA